MDNVKEIAQFFLLALSLGVSPFVLLVQRKDTGDGFFRLIYSVILSCIVLFILSLYFLPDGKNAFFAPSLAMLVLCCFAPLSKNRLYAVIVPAGIAYFSYYWFDRAFWPYLYFLSSSFLLGTVTFSMLLGHWYLVTPKLTTRPLVISMKFFWAVISMKLIGFFFEMSKVIPMSGEVKAGLGSFDLILFTMRFLWGYGILLLLSYFGWKLIKMRSLQSATGILYVMVFFVLVGEMMGVYFYYTKGVYL